MKDVRFRLTNPGRFRLLLALSCPSKQGGVRPLRPDSSDLNLFCYCKRVIDLDP